MGNSFLASIKENQKAEYYWVRTLLGVLRQRRERWPAGSLSSGKRMLIKNPNKSALCSTASCSATSLATALSSRSWGTKTSSTVCWTWSAVTGRWGDWLYKSFAFLYCRFSESARQTSKMPSWLQMHMVSRHCSSTMPVPCQQNIVLFWVQVPSRL